MARSICKEQVAGLAHLTTDFSESLLPQLSGLRLGGRRKSAGQSADQCPAGSNELASRCLSTGLGKWALWLWWCVGENFSKSAHRSWYGGGASRDGGGLWGDLWKNQLLACSGGVIHGAVATACCGHLHHQNQSNCACGQEEKETLHQFSESGRAKN